MCSFLCGVLLAPFLLVLGLLVAVLALVPLLLAAAGLLLGSLSLLALVPVVFIALLGASMRVLIGVVLVLFGIWLL